MGRRRRQHEREKRGEGASSRRRLALESRRRRRRRRICGRYKVERGRRKKGDFSTPKKNPKFLDRSASCVSFEGGSGRVGRGVGGAPSVGGGLGTCRKPKGIAVVCGITRYADTRIPDRLPQQSSTAVHTVQYYRLPFCGPFFRKK